MNKLKDYFEWYDGDGPILIRRSYNHVSVCHNNNCKLPKVWEGHVHFEASSIMIVERKIFWRYSKFQAKLVIVYYWNKYRGPKIKAATRIQRAWRRCVSDPSYKICRARLMREFEELQW